MAPSRDLRGDPQPRREEAGGRLVRLDGGFGWFLRRLWRPPHRLEPGTLTGSIGVILEGGNYERLMEKVGVRSVVVKSGPFKDILSPTRR